MDKIEEIFANNQQWITEKLAVDADYFENLGKGQSPEFLYIGCSDSSGYCLIFNGCAAW